MIQSLYVTVDGIKVNFDIFSNSNVFRSVNHRPLEGDCIMDNDDNVYRVGRLTWLNKNPITHDPLVDEMILQVDLSKIDL